MAISTNRPGHRATDLSDWGPTLKKSFSILQASTSPITWNSTWANQKQFQETNYEMETDLTFFLA